MSWAGAHVIDGRGSGSGWISLNIAGTPLSVKFVGVTMAMRPDYCSFQVNFSMQVSIGNTSVTLGPYSRIYVIAGQGENLELYGMLVGGGPGTWVDSSTAHRISTEFDIEDRRIGDDNEIPGAVHEKKAPENDDLRSILSGALAGGESAACSNWTNWDLRGTITKAGSGWIDLSKLAPGFPAGMVPMAWVGAEVLDGRGGGNSWIAFNAGGVQVTIDLIDFKYSMQANCEVKVSFSGRFRELGITAGPLSRVVVVGRKQEALELYGIFTGEGPGTLLDLIVGRRVSMEH